MRTTVRLPERLARAAKIKARKEGLTMTQVIEDGVRAFVKRPVAAPAGWTLPVSSARGKCLVDTSSHAELLDLMEAGLPYEKLR